MTVQELMAKAKAGEVVVRHTSTMRGYVSRKSDGKVISYKGRFGEGFIHLKPRWDSSQYVSATYYINK